MTKINVQQLRIKNSRLSKLKADKQTCGHFGGGRILLDR